jgi:hypothetical protein
MTADGSPARNRTNAQKSTGPRTPAGKAAAAQNARRHGGTAQPKPTTVSTWLSVILDCADVTPSDFIPQEERGFRAVALARAEAQLVAAEVALRDFEVTAISPGETVPRQISDATAMLLDLSGHARRSKDMQLNTTLLRMLRHTERDELVLGCGRHNLLNRYAREARARRWSAFSAWLEVVTDEGTAA